MKIGYCRVSTKQQSLDRQKDQLIEAGVDSRLIYEEVMTGTKKERPELIRMIENLQEGDVVVITDLTRISRSTKDLLQIIDLIKEKGASIKSLKDNWLDTSSESPYGNFLLTVMSGLSELERNLISQRTKEGLESARARGRVGGRPRGRDEKAEYVMFLVNQGMKIKDICDKTGISRSTVYRIIEESKSAEV
jgi:DNA invertase Pin-like site-specific DNA recombinase